MSDPNMMEAASRSTRRWKPQTEEAACITRILDVKMAMPSLLLLTLSVSCPTVALGALDAGLTLWFSGGGGGCGLR